MLIRGDIFLREFFEYVISQVIGALAGTASLGANGFGSLSASNISLVGALIVEVILTFVFIYAILGVISLK